MNNEDKLFSTFYWKIILDNNNPKNRKDIVLTGYSKMEGRNEKQDKMHLLFNIILRMNKCGYFEKFEKWKIYKRTGDFCNEQNDINFLTLYPNDFKILETTKLEDRHKTNHSTLVKFLTDFYNARKNKVDFTYLLPVEKKAVNLDNLLCYHKQKFETIKELYYHCEKLQKSGFAFGQIEHFKLMYLQKNNL